MYTIVGLISPIIKLIVIWALAHWVVNSIHYARVYEEERIQQFQKDNENEINMKVKEGMAQ
jgi:hypothetical protein